MKVWRTILCVDDGLLAAELGVILRMHGYCVVSCRDERGCRRVLKQQPVDLVILGPHIVRFDDSRCPVTVHRLVLDGLQLAGGWAHLVERVRILLVRKRGPRPYGVRSQCGSVVDGRRTA